MATVSNSPHYDFSYFGKQNSTKDASGYTGTPDMFHPVGPFDDGLTYSYMTFQTGTDAQGAPTMAMTVKAVSWNGTTHAWNSWTTYESMPVSQVAPGMVAQRFVK